MWPATTTAVGGNEKCLSENVKHPTATKSRIIFQSWLHFAAENSLDPYDKDKWDEETTSSNSNKDSPNSTLHHTKAPLYGICPAQDEFLTVKCKQCSIFLKPVAHRAHMNYRHNVLLKSPDVAGQFAWSSVISPPPPPSVDAPKAESSSTIPVLASSSSNVNDVAVTVDVNSVSANDDVFESHSTNIFDKFSILEAGSSKSIIPNVKLKKPKLSLLKTNANSVVSGPPRILSSTKREKFKAPSPSTFPINSEDYVVTQKSDHRLKITISKKALKAEPISVSGTKWTIPKMEHVTPKKAKNVHEMAKLENAKKFNKLSAPSVVEYEKIDVKEYIDYCLPTSSTDSLLPITPCSIAVPSMRPTTIEHRPSSIVSSSSSLESFVDNRLMYLQPQRVQLSAVKPALSNVKRQMARRYSWDRNNNVHPKASAMCTYGARRFGKSSYVFGRKNDMIRQAFEAALDEDYDNKLKVITTSNHLNSRAANCMKFNEAAASRYSVESSESGGFEKFSQSDGYSNGNNSPNGNVSGSWCKMSTTMTQNVSSSRPVTVSVVPQDLLTQLLNSNNNNNNNGSSSSTCHTYGTNNGTTLLSSQREKMTTTGTTFTTINLNNLSVGATHHLTGGYASEKTKVVPDYGSNAASVGCFATVGRANAATIKRNNRKRDLANGSAAVLYGGRCGGTKRARNSNFEIGTYSSAASVKREIQLFPRNKAVAASRAFNHHYITAAKSIIHHSHHHPSIVRPANSNVGGVQTNNVVQRLLQGGGVASSSAVTTPTATVLTLPPNAVIVDGNKIYTVQNGPNGPQLVEGGLSSDCSNLQSVLNPNNDSPATPAAIRAIQPKFVTSYVVQQPGAVQSGNSAYMVQNSKVQSNVNQIQQHSFNNARAVNNSSYPQTVVVCAANSDSSPSTNGVSSTQMPYNQQQPWVVNLRSQSNIKSSNANQINCRLQQPTSSGFPLRFTVSSNSSSTTPNVITVVSGVRTSITAPVVIRGNGSVQQQQNVSGTSLNNSNIQSNLNHAPTVRRHC